LVGFGTNETVTDIKVSYEMDESGWNVENEYACVLSSLGRVKCWGNPRSAAVLGQESSASPVTNPSLISPIKFGTGRTVKQITLGRQHVCALLDNNGVVRT
jgi:hypothetical protein